MHAGEIFKMRIIQSPWRTLCSESLAGKAGRSKSLGRGNLRILESRHREGLQGLEKLPKAKQAIVLPFISEQGNRLRSTLLLVVLY